MWSKSRTKRVIITRQTNCLNSIFDNFLFTSFSEIRREGVVNDSLETKPTVDFETWSHNDLWAR